MGGHRFNPEKAHKLDNPERRKLMPPERILQEFQIHPSDVVLDLGAGTGYFTLPASRMTEKEVYALDLEPRMLALLQEKVRQTEAAANVHVLQGAIENIPLESQSVDKIIASLVLHESDDLKKTLREMQRVLRPGGRILIIEWEKQQTEEGPPLSERIAVEEMEETIRNVGMEIERRVRENGMYYLLHVKQSHVV